MPTLAMWSNAAYTVQYKRWKCVCLESVRRGWCTTGNDSPALMKRWQARQRSERTRDTDKRLSANSHDFTNIFLFKIDAASVIW
jgi:hypothetical protein